MADAITAEFEELVLEIEADPTGSPGVYSKICGITDASINRTAAVNTTEVPDCDDESLPLSVRKQIRNISVTVDGTGVWAMQSNKMMKDWFYSSASLKVRITNAKVQADGASGDPYVESGPALLTTLNDDRTKGDIVKASIQIEFDGTPAVTNKV